MLTAPTATTLILCLLHLTTCLPLDTCTNRTLGSRKGVIRLDLSRSPPLNCSWTVRPPNHHVTTVRILDLQLGDCTSGDGGRLTLRLGDRDSVELCAQATAPQLMSLRQDRFDIRLETTSSPAAALWLDYWTRPADQCPDHDFQCHDAGNCFNYAQHCDGRFDCADHSDEVNCGRCVKVAAPCSDVPFACFDPIVERCNGVVDCVGGEDEFNCTTSCRGAVKCGLHEDRCIANDQICDGRTDCDDGMDEDNCRNLFCKNEKSSKAYAKRCKDYAPSDTLRTVVIAVLTIVLALSLLFGTLIYRWYRNRRDIRVLIADMPEFPLPPFEGPGEERSEGGDSSPAERFSVNDFSVGGEIYEAYVQTRRRISSEGGRHNGKKRKAMHLPMSAPSTKSNSPDLMRNRSEASLVGAPCLSRDQTIEGVVEDFYEDDFPLEIKYVNNSFFDDKSQRGNEEGGRKAAAAGFKNLFRKKRVWSAGDCDKSRRNECDYEIFTVTNSK